MRENAGYKSHAFQVYVKTHDIEIGDCYTTLTHTIESTNKFRNTDLRPLPISTNIPGFTVHAFDWNARYLRQIGIATKNRFHILSHLSMITFTFLSFDATVYVCMYACFNERQIEIKPYISLLLDENEAASTLCECVQLIFRYFISLEWFNEFSMNLIEPLSHSMWMSIIYVME